jgi:hypothetical protein
MRLARARCACVCVCVCVCVRVRVCVASELTPFEYLSTRARPTFGPPTLTFPLKLKICQDQSGRFRDIR